MKKFIDKLLANHTLIYKLMLYMASIFLVVYLFPKGTHFKYKFQKGKVWRYKDMYAPFDFAIQKSSKDIEKEKDAIKKNAKKFFDNHPDIAKKSTQNFIKKTTDILDTLAIPLIQKKNITNSITNTLNKIYEKGIVSQADKLKATNPLIHLKRGTSIKIISTERLLSTPIAQKTISENLKNLNPKTKEVITQLINNEIQPNITYNEEFTTKIIDDELKNVSYTKGLVTNNERIISRGDIIEGQKFEKLESLKKEFESKIWSKYSYYWITAGHIILAAIIFLMILLFINRHRKDIYEDNTKLTFIFFNIIVITILSVAVLKYNATYIYIVPIVILPLIMKAFFDNRLGLFVYLNTVLLIGIIMPNAFEFIIVHIMAGMVTILTTSELSKRANLFISVLQITAVYFITYFAFSIIQEGSISHLEWEKFLYFALNGMATLFVLPLIYIFEKLFSLTSDESLKELSNTNSKLLRTLSEKAPGTFQHSLQVANLSEAAANAINANAMLVRTGALYHDIGKMEDPTLFTENQSTSVNPHNELTPRDSAKIIIGHVIKGIELAKKNRLPDRIIDFIRTHHGTSLVYYFYKKEEELYGIANEADFRYPGPIPFSKETAILMICDSIEAASKSLKEPSAQSIDTLVEKIINKQMDEKQFMNADITFKELEKIKKILKKKLKNIYHLRIKYPE